MPSEPDIIDPLLLTIDVAANKLGMSGRAFTAPINAARSRPRSDRPKCTLAHRGAVGMGERRLPGSTNLGGDAWFAKRLTS